MAFLPEVDHLVDSMWEQQKVRIIFLGNKEF